MNSSQQMSYIDSFLNSSGMSDLLPHPNFGIQESIESYCSAEGPSNYCSSPNEGSAGNERYLSSEALYPADRQSETNSFECQCNDCSGGKVSQIYEDAEEFPDMRSNSEKKLKVITSYHSHFKKTDGYLEYLHECSVPWIVPSESEIRDQIGQPASYLDFERGSRGSSTAGGIVLGPIIKSSVATSEVSSEECTCINQESCCMNESRASAPYVMAVRESLECCQLGNSWSVNRTRCKYSTPNKQESSSSEISHGASSELLELIPRSASRLVESENSDTTQPQIIAPSENFRAPMSCTQACISSSIVTSYSSSATCTCVLQGRVSTSQHTDIVCPMLDLSGSNRVGGNLDCRDASGIVRSSVNSSKLPSVPKEDSPLVPDNPVDTSVMSSGFFPRLDAVNRLKHSQESLPKDNGLLAKIEPSSVLSSNEKDALTCMKALTSSPSVMGVLESSGLSGSAIRASKSSGRTPAGKSITSSMQKCSNSEISPGAPEMMQLISKATVQKEESKQSDVVQTQTVAPDKFSTTPPACSSCSAVTSSSTSATCTCVPQDKPTCELKKSEVYQVNSNVACVKQASTKESSGALCQAGNSKSVVSNPKEDFTTPLPDDSVGSPLLSDSIHSISVTSSSKSSDLRLGENNSKPLQENDGVSSKQDPFSSPALGEVRLPQSSASGKPPVSPASKSFTPSNPSKNQFENLEPSSNTRSGKTYKMDGSSTSGPQREKSNHLTRLRTTVCKENRGRSVMGRMNMHVMESSKSDASGRPTAPFSTSSSDFSSSLGAPETAVGTTEKGTTCSESPMGIAPSSLSQLSSKVLSGTEQSSEFNLPSVHGDPTQLTNSSVLCNNGRNPTSNDKKSKGAKSIDANCKLKSFGAQDTTDGSSLGQNRQEISSQSGTSTRPLASLTTSRKFKDELELSTLLSVAYVRVRDLTNAIARAHEYLSNMEKEETDEIEDELRANIETMFECRANLSLERARWRGEFSSHYRQRRQILADLKTQSDDLVNQNLELRQQVNNLAEEPAVMKRKKSLLKKFFSCGLVN